MMDRFELQGAIYYQQGRKCGNNFCQCANGDLHGPYWYKREMETGKVKYLGRDLPDNITKAREMLLKSLPGIRAKIRLLSAKQTMLEDQMNALEYLIAGQALNEHDAEIVHSLGFRKCIIEDE